MADTTVYDRANLYLDAGRPAEAVALLATHLASEPDDVTALCLNGQALCAAGDSTAGLRSAQRAASLAPEYEWAWRVVAQASSANGDHVAARAAAARAKQIAPESWRTHLHAASIDLSADTVTPATEDAANRAAELAPNEPQAHLVVGNVALRKKYWGQAERAYRRALELDPHLQAAQNNLALVTLNRGRVGAAAAGFVDILAVDPTSMLARRNVLAAFAALVARVRIVVLAALLLTYFVRQDVLDQQPGTGSMTTVDVHGPVAIAVIAALGLGLIFLFARFVRGAGARLGQIMRAVRRFDPLLLVVAVGLVVTYAILLIASTPLAPDSGWRSLAILLYFAVILVSMVRNRRTRNSRP